MPFLKTMQYVMARNMHRDFEELTTDGFLWLINRVVFHPRGFALAISVDNKSGHAVGWTILGDGSEPYTFTDNTDNEKFPIVEEALQQWAEKNRESK